VQAQSDTLEAIVKRQYAELSPFLHLPLNAVFCRLGLSALQSGTDSATSLEISGERNGRIAPSHDAVSESA
jgi:hypothetical protein